MMRALAQKSGNGVMKKRVLITGGAGFIGSHLCGYLVEKGYYVICMDNLITGSTENISHLLKRKNFRFVKHDVTKYINIGGPLSHVLHFASPASPIDYSRYPIQTLKVGSLGTHNALGVAKAKKARFLLASTSEVYGDPAVHPQPEDYWGNVNHIGPRGVYDESKRFAEALTMAYHHTHRLNVKIARIFNTYGPRMRRSDGRAVPTFIEQILTGKPITIFGNGSHTRSFCYISDLIVGIYRLLKSGVHSPVNIGSPEEISILKLARKMAGIAGTKTRIIFKKLPKDDPKTRQPDITLAKKKLKWRPTVSLDEGLRRTIDWCRKAYRS